MKVKLHIGMRKIKSVLALFISFVFWQGLRVFFPILETHPIFAYVYSIIEMRESPEKTKDAGKLRLLATVIGLAVGLVFVFCSVHVNALFEKETVCAFFELVFIMAAALFALIVAEISGCKEFCGAAAIISVICMVSHDKESVLLYAVMRALQTVIGVLAAILVNQIGRKREI